MAKLDEEYIAPMEDVLALYEKPLSEQEPVVCVDEKPVVLHQEIRPPLVMKPGGVARRDGEYKRCGTANVFCGVEPKAGRHFPKVTASRSSLEFVAAKKPHHSAFILQGGHIDIQIKPVYRLELEGDVIVENLGYAVW